MGGLATVAIGFLLGFVLAGRATEDPGGSITAAGPGGSTTTAAPDASPTSPPVGTDPPPTGAPAPTTTQLPATTVTTAAPPVPTEAPPPTTEAPTTAPPTTAAPSTTPATTAVAPVLPSRIVASYATDSLGRLVLPRGGTANLVLVNEGGLAQQWLVTGTGFAVVGSNQGTLGPGQRVVVTLAPPREELPAREITGTASVLGAVNPAVAFVIPAA